MLRMSLVVAGLLTLAGPTAAQQLRVITPGDRDLLRTRMPLTTDTLDNYVVQDGLERLSGSTVRAISLSRDAPEQLWEIRTSHWLTGRDTSHSTMAVRVADLSLAWHRVKAPRDSAAVTAVGRHLTGWVVLPDRPIRLLDRGLDRPVFGVEGQIPWLLPLLPLAPGFRAAVPHFSQWDGGETMDTVTVVGRERVAIGERSFDCWHVDAGPLGPPGFRRHIWIDAATRRVVQAALRGDGPGVEYLSRLRN